VEQNRNHILATNIIDIISEKINLVLDLNLQNYAIIREAFIKSCIEFLYNLLIKFEEVPVSLVPQIYKIIPIFTNTYIFRDDHIFSMCIWGLSRISGISDENEIKILELIMNNNGDLLNTLLALDYDTYKELLIPSLQIMGNLISVYNKNFVEFILSFGVIDFLNTILLSEKSKKIIKKVLWVVSNISGGDYEHIKQIVEHQIFNKVLELCNDYDFSTKKEAIFTVHNICTHKLNFTISTFLIKKGVFNMIKDVLETYKDPLLLEMVLTSLNCILCTAIPIISLTGTNNLSNKFEQLGGIASLEKMQEHANDNIYRLSLSILETHFKTHLVSYSDMVRDYAENNYCENNIVEDRTEYQQDLQNQGYSYPNSNIMSGNKFAVGSSINQTNTFSFHASLSLENDNNNFIDQNSRENKNINKFSNLFNPINHEDSNKRNFYHNDK
jgi:hypothetical protein